jgi:DNA-binding MarR family transcriptional regulator
MLEIVPAVMRCIRQQFHSRRWPGMSVPQFRALWLIGEKPSACLSAVADHIGSSLPSASRLVAGLVAHSLVTRKIDLTDRRHCCLALTTRGRAALKAAWDETHEYIVREVASLTTPERSTIVEAMALLRAAFAAQENARG